MIDQRFMRDHPIVILTIFNVVFKKAFRQTHLKQIGRDSKFYDYERPITD